MSRKSDFTRLVAVEGPKLRRFLRRFGPAVSPEDIAQDSFARLYAAEADTSEAARAFLFRTARNLAIDAIRRAAAAPVRGGGWGEVEVRSTEPDPEERLVLCEQVTWLKRALRALPRHKRLALLLFKLERCSYKEIGLRLGVSPRTVERYVADAVSHCQAELGGLRED
jgi:RNA polymerase sigma-70 factor (ECF subfamily)